LLSRSSGKESPARWQPLKYNIAVGLYPMDNAFTEDWECADSQ
jgi:hypothetical protein